LSRDLIVGLGIPQIAELILTKGTKSFAEMIPGLAKKTMLTARLLKQCRFLELDLCNNSRRNAEFLLKEIK
jgi:hypothetical protein